MDKKTVFVKTEKGENESLGLSDALYGDVKRLLHLVDDESTVAEITKRAPPSLRETLQDTLQELVDSGYIKDMRAPVKTVKKPDLKFATPAFKMATPKVAAPSTSAQPASRVKKEEPVRIDKKSDLDFSFIMSESSPEQNKADKQKVIAEAKTIAEAIAQVEASKKAEAQKKALQEAAAKAKAEAQDKAGQDASGKAAKAKAYEDAKIKAQIEVQARAKIEAEARAKKAAEDAAKLKTEQEALKARAESVATKARIEAEVRARLEAEAKFKLEADAKRIKAEQVAEKLRLELEAAKAKAATELRNRIEAEARAKVEHEARLKREADAERLMLEKERAELEVARIKAEAELRMREEAEIRVRAALDARMKADTLADSANVQQDQGEKLRQSFVESFGQHNKKRDTTTGSFKLEQFSLVDTGKIKAFISQEDKPKSLPGAGTKVKAAIAEKAKIEAEKKSTAEQVPEKVMDETEAQASRIKAQQEEALVKAKAEQDSIRMKAEHEAYLLKVKQEEEQAKIAVETQKLADQQSKQWEEAQHRAAMLAKSEKDRLAKESAEALAKSKRKTTRGPRKSLPIGKTVAGLFVLALLAAVGLPYVWSPDEYIAPIEAEIAAHIKQPVHIKKINFVLLPLPKLELRSITVGQAEELKIESAELNFDLSAYFAATKSINKLKLNNVTLAGATLDNAIALLQSAGGIEKYPVAHMEFIGLNIKSNDLKFPTLTGRANFDPQGKFTHAKLKTEDEKIKMELQMQQGNLQLEFNLRESSLPIFSGIKFNDLSFKAAISNSEATFTDFFAHIHGGTLTGKGQLNWNSGWTLQSQMNGRNVDLHQMFPNLGVTGELLGDVNISMASPTIGQLDNVDKDFLVEGSFEAKNGEIAKLDVETIARFGARQGVAGHTSFTELAGTLKVDRHGQRIFVSNLASAAANSTGLIDIDGKQKLSGKLQVDIKGLGIGSISLQLSGTLSEPILQPVH